MRVSWLNIIELKVYYLSLGNLERISSYIISVQLTQAMSYLHSRGIVHGHLTSRNVFIEAKVSIQLSVLNHGMIDVDLKERDFKGAKIARRILNYYPPEVNFSCRKMYYKLLTISLYCIN